MTSQKESVSEQRRPWTDWLSAHMWWTTLIAGGVLCVVALILS
jgi:hypothetical protein